MRAALSSDLGLLAVGLTNIMLPPLLHIPIISRGTRLPSFTLGWHALLSLSMRICNPPPAASRVRSCKDDVLNKRHLLPLTLKDFEEWLVFVGIQYLCFIL
ncbi:hypothetical protein JB92DRAFT_183542 [Gautieria morchelliformis]|nr:hypothetical protein JB92DRAFT_183542 [Gautieria morchelliformis]